MLSLIETLTGFAAIMLMLSLLVKTLTSVIKNQWDYYSDNLEHEVKRLVLETTGKTWDAILTSGATPARVKNIAMDIHWERLGEEFLTPAHLSWFLKELDPNARVSDLESRLKIHMANVNYTFQMRMKNLAMAAGLGLCLLCNINAFTIWKSLYTDQQLRSKFSGAYADRALALANGEPAKKAETAPNGQPTQPAQPPSKSEQKESISSFQANMQGFLTDVSFGVGRIWKEECLVLSDEKRQACQKVKREQTAKAREESRWNRYCHRMEDADKLEGEQKKGEARIAAETALIAELKADSTETELKLAQEEKDPQDPPVILLYEFFGSLLTGILVSIGAPYWHDILQALSSLRFTPAAAKTKV